MAIRVTVWGENVHDRENATVRGIYPKGMHGAIAEALNEDAGIKATTATLDQPEHGLTREAARARPTCSPGGATRPMARWPTRSSSGSPSGSGRAWA